MSNKAFELKTPVEIIKSIPTMEESSAPFSSSVYVTPSIPEKKINGAIKGIAKNSLSPESVLLICDTTLFGSADTGMLLSDTTIYYREMLEDAKFINFCDIKSVEYIKDVTTDKKGKEVVTESVVISSDDDSISVKGHEINAKNFSDFMTLIFESVKNVDSEKVYVERKPLEEMPISIKKSYIYVVMNFLLHDDGVIDSAEFTELYKLISRLKFTAEERFEIQDYVNTQIDTHTLIEEMFSNLDEITKSEFKISIIKDIMYTHKLSKKDTYENSNFILELAEYLHISKGQLELVNKAIENDLKIFDDNVDDEGLKAGFSNIVSSAGAVGVPLAALYFSGSVVGLGATGITSGLAALGFGGVLGFSSMLTGIGAIILLGVGAKKGLEHLTGKGSLEKRKLKEAMLVAINKQLQSSVNLMVEDINFMTLKITALFSDAANKNMTIEQMKGQYLLLVQRLQKATSSSQALSKERDMTENKAVRQKVPVHLAVDRLSALTNQPTTQKYYDIVVSCYIEKDGKYTLREDISLDDINSLNEILTKLDYFGASSLAKQGLSAVKGMFN